MVISSFVCALPSTTPIPAAIVTAQPDPHLDATAPVPSRDLSQAPSRPESSPTPADAVEEINTTLQAWSTNLRFEIDPSAQRLVVSLIDSATGDVLRTIPNEVVLHLARMVASLQGNIVDTTA